MTWNNESESNYESVSRISTWISFEKKKFFLKKVNHKALSFKLVKNTSNDFRRIKISSNRG